MRYPADHRPRIRQWLIRIAARTVMEQGTKEVGVASVMKAAGLTHGGFYLHFESRDALIEAALGYLFQRMVRRWERETSGRSPESALASYIDFYLSPGHRKAVHRGCPISVIAGNLQDLSERSRDIYVASTDALSRSLADLLDVLQRPHPTALARSALAELAGAIALARFEEREDVANEILESSRDALKQRLGLTVSRSASH